jgi:small subunit ribosomal protein S16
MVKIRLRRVGAKKQPSYRVVVADSRSPRDGKFIETIGNYNPRTEPPTMVVDLERARYWLSVGAQPSDAVRRILDKLMAAEAEAETAPAMAAEEPPAMPAEPVAEAPETAVAVEEAIEEAEAVSAESEAGAVLEEPEAEAIPDTEATPEAEAGA